METELDKKESGFSIELCAKLYKMGIDFKCPFASFLSKEGKIDKENSEILHQMLKEDASLINEGYYSHGIFASVLFLAVKKRNLKTLETLINYGAKTNIMSGFEFPLNVAIHRGYSIKECNILANGITSKDIMEQAKVFVVNECLPINFDFSFEFMRFIDFEIPEEYLEIFKYFSNDVHVKQMLSCGGSFSIEENLISAPAWGGFILPCLPKGIKFNISKVPLTPIQKAICKGNTKAVKLLLELGIDIHILNGSYESVFLKAIQYDKYDILIMLLEYAEKGVPRKIYLTNEYFYLQEMDDIEKYNKYRSALLSYKHGYMENKCYRHLNAWSASKIPISGSLKRKYEITEEETKRLKTDKINYPISKSVRKSSIITYSDVITTTKSEEMTPLPKIGLNEIDSLNKLTVPRLKEKCKKMGIKISGRRNEIIERIKKANIDLK